MSYGLRGCDGSVQGLGLLDHCSMGLGDCTPASCSGPYSNPVFNYDYWLNQTGAGASAPAGPITTPITTAQQHAVTGPPPSMSLWDLQALFGIPYNCDPRDVQCVDCQSQASVAAQTLWAQSGGSIPVGTKINWTCDKSPAALQSFLVNNPQYQPPAPTVTTPATTVAYTSSGAPVNAPVAASSTATTPSAAAPSYSPHVTFAASRQGTLQPGDVWQVSITGAQPGSQIVVKGGKGGAQDQTVMGSADSSGSFSLTGTITADQAGSWNETWSAGGKVAGSFGFSVVVPASPSAPATGSPAPATGSPAGGSAPATGSAPAAGSAALSIGGFDLSSIPWWGWAGGAAALLFAFGGKR